MKTIPYTYTVTFKPTGQYYYGYRGRKGCHPNDLWQTYFTSSKIVKELISQYGLDAFEIRIRRIFKTADLARQRERRILLRINARNNKKMLNQSNGGKGFTLVKHTEETKLKISKARKGMKFTSEHCENIGNAARGRKCKIETRVKLSNALKGRSFSEAHRKALSDKAFDRKHTEETKAKIGEQGRGRKLTDEQRLTRSSNKPCVADGKEYASISEAARALGLKSPESVKYRISVGKKGYYYV